MTNVTAVVDLMLGSRSLPSDRFSVFQFVAPALPSLLGPICYKGVMGQDRHSVLICKICRAGSHEEVRRHSVQGQWVRRGV